MTPHGKLGPTFRAQFSRGIERFGRIERRTDEAPCARRCRRTNDTPNPALAGARPTDFDVAGERAKEHAANNFPI